VFKRETPPMDRVADLVFLGDLKPPLGTSFHQCGLNTPSPSLERGTGGEVLDTFTTPRPTPDTTTNTPTHHHPFDQTP